jgi:hypothetical protein
MSLKRSNVAFVSFSVRSEQIHCRRYAVSFHLCTSTCTQPLHVRLLDWHIGAIFFISDLFELQKSQSQSTFTGLIIILRVDSLLVVAFAVAAIVEEIAEARYVDNILLSTLFHRISRAGVLRFHRYVARKVPHTRCEPTNSKVMETCFAAY